MNYSYNYGFLREFMEANKLSKRDLLQALGTTDYVGLNKWLDGKLPIHVIAMLRLCNYYNIPLSNFFYDQDGMPAKIEPLMPEADSQIRPTDDYQVKHGVGNGIVSAEVTDRAPRSKSQERMVAEGLERQAEQLKQRDEAIQAARNAVDGPDGGSEVHEPREPYMAHVNLTEYKLRMELEHSREIRALEKQHREQEDRIRKECQTEFATREMRLLDIIEKANAGLNKRLAEAMGHKDTDGK